VVDEPSGAGQVDGSPDPGPDTEPSGAGQVDGTPGAGPDTEPSGAFTCFEVLDALDGFTRLVRRSPTLDGAVPLRAAQACLPLLEGNAFGFQLELTRPVVIRRRLGGLAVDVPGTAGDQLARIHAGALPRLAAQGFLEPGGAWHRALRDHPVLRRSRRIRLWTGLLVRPDPGTWLRLSGTANRRNTLIEVEEAILRDDGRFIPVVLDIVLRDDAPDVVRLEGEIGCLAPIQPGVRFTPVALADAPEVGRAHVAFYDARYFRTKQGQVTRKYRRRVAQLEPSGRPAAEAVCRSAAEAVCRSAAEAVCRLVNAGPETCEVHPTTRFLTASSVDPIDDPGETRRLDQVLFRNALPFSAAFDGSMLPIDPDRERLAVKVAALERLWRDVYGDAFMEANRGAIWYLTKYFTPHPPGEPHFFVKPWSFVVTPPGWSCLLEGLHGDGYDVMRGMVHTDVFHATPAVFQLYRRGVPIDVREGAPLLRVLPIPRRLLEAGDRPARWLDQDP
jgi:hypothetical protein